MNPEDFISLAGWLAANTTIANAEARLRTAVSRAYYGAFLASVDVLAQLGVVVPANHRGHEIAVKKLLGSGHRQAVLASRFIGDLRSRRNDADYNLKTVKYRQQGNAMLAVQDAANAIFELRACLDEPVRSELRELFARA